jgi:zinc protease
MRVYKSFMMRGFILCILGLCAFTSGCLEQAAKGPNELKYPALPDIKVPEVRQVTLDNGMRLMLLEDHELPLINLSARIRVGSIYEPADKIGLADITGEVMRTGGTIAKTGDELDEELESLAASVETGIGVSSGFASMSVLKKDVDKGLGILADVLMNPAFREHKIQLAKIQHRSSIARRNDDPGEITSREFEKLIYGPDSVYARQTEYATIDNITRDDLMEFHRKYFCPNNTMLAVCGDFDTDQMIRKIESAFEGWEKCVVELPDVPKVAYEYPSTVNLVKKTDINQSNIRLGHIGGLMSDPDYFPLIVMNRILGSGFTGRLFRNVRSREGLAYTVYGYYDSNYEYPGMFYVGCQTKSENTVKAINAMIEEVRKITQSEVTDEELALAKESFLNSFVFNFDSKREIVGRLMTYEYYGYPADFLQKMKTSIEKVTKTDILRVARKNLQPDKVQILAVGKPEDFGQPLSEFGTVNEIDITIPPPAQ